jgi:hypothetical protein
MNIKSLSEKTRLCIRSEAMIAEILVRSYARKFALSCFAALTILMGVVFLNIALFIYLQMLWGPVWTPLVIGLGNFALAGLAVGLASLMKPGPELQMALELRKLSATTLEEELQSMQFASGLLGSLGGAPNFSVTKLLLPAVISIVGAMRRRKAATKT